MSFSRRNVLALLLAACTTLASAKPRGKAKPASAPAGSQNSASSFNVPVDYYKLPNGLRVALSPDHSAPIRARSFCLRKLSAGVDLV